MFSKNFKTSLLTATISTICLSSKSLDKSDLNRNQSYHAMAVAQPSDTRSFDSSADGTDDREARSKIWVAIYSRPNSEKKLAQELSKFGIEIYVPIQSQLHQWRDRKKTVDVVIIPMIVFAHIKAEDIALIRTRLHVIKILTYPGQTKPADIPDVQIERLKFMLKNADSDVSFVSNVYIKDDSVEVVRGSLMGLIGQVERTAEGNTNLIIIMDMLGGAKVSISPSDLKPLRK